MKTRRLTTIMTSAYLSVLLASIAVTVHGETILAAPIDPMAAQKALQRAMSGLDAAGWTAVSTPAAVTVPPVAVASLNNSPRKTAPVMNEELMARLIKYTRDVQETGSFSARLCKVLNLCDGTKNMPLKYAISDSTDGIHYFGLLRPEEDSKDILIVVRHGEMMEAYLTDKTGKLRAAAVLEDGTARLITNEKAAEKFKAELSLFAGEAESLPPTGTSVVNNS